MKAAFSLLARKAFKSHESRW